MRELKYSVLPEKRNTDDIIISMESTIHAPIDIVFDVITDIELFAELERGIKSVTITSDIKEGAGMKSHWILEDQITGEEWALDEEILFSDRPYQYGYIGLAGGKDYSGVHTLTENPDGSVRHQFNEAFYFDVNEAEYGDVVEGMVANVKKEAERRAAAR